MTDNQQLSLPRIKTRGHAYVSSQNPHQANINIKPESTPPINDSPSYSIEVGPLENPYTLVLNFGHYTPRYWPRSKRLNWARLPKQQVTIQTIHQPHQLTITRSPSPQGDIIASQAPFSGDDYLTWLKNCQTQHPLSLINIGHTPDQHIVWMGKQTRTLNPTLVCIARQHPPEVNAQQACMAFCEALWQTPYHDYTTLCIGHANPDGINLYHWRHNARDADINRDWGLFTQPETQIIHQAIQQHAPIPKQAWIVDFHAHGSSEPVIYFKPSTNASCSDPWPPSPQTRHFTVIDPKNSRPNGCRHYHASLGYHALCVEIPDSLESDAARLLGLQLAKSFMKA